MYNYNDGKSISQFDDLEETIKSSLLLLENTNTPSSYMRECHPANFTQNNIGDRNFLGETIYHACQQIPNSSNSGNELRRLMSLYYYMKDHTLNETRMPSYTENTDSYKKNNKNAENTANNYYRDNITGLDYEKIINELFYMRGNSFNTSYTQGNKSNYHPNYETNKFNHHNLKDWASIECYSDMSIGSTNYSESDSVESDSHMIPKYFSNYLKEINRHSRDIGLDTSNLTRAQMSAPNKLLPSITKRLEKTQLCRHFARNGRCANGLNCAFAHSLSELRERPDLTKTTICADFQMGRCKYGDCCKHAHTVVELRATTEFFKTSLCPDFMRLGTCIRGKSCRYAHGPSDLRQRSA